MSRVVNEHVSVLRSGGPFALSYPALFENVVLTDSVVSALG